MHKTSNPCVLLMNDIHISKDNILEFIINWNEALSLCDQLGIHHIVIGGDLFQSRAAQTLDILLAVHDAFVAANERGIFLLLANGNHDKVNLEAIRGYCHVFDTHPNVRVVNNSFSLSETGWQFTLHVIPYFPESGSFKEKLEEVKNKKRDLTKLNYLYIHEGVNGALSHESDDELPAHYFTGFDKTFVAHYHNRCVIPDTEIVYIGSSRQHNFGEDEEKGYTLLFVDGGYEFVKNKKNIRYQVIDKRDDEITPAFINELRELKASGRYKIKVRVHTTAMKADSIEKEKLMEAGANKVEVITEIHELLRECFNASSFSEKFDLHHIKKNYEDFCKEKNIEDPALGLSYLSKIQY